jgi:hypothetical protein
MITPANMNALATIILGIALLWHLNHCACVGG